MIMLGALGALTATLPAEFLLVSVGWRGLFELLAIASAGCALAIYLVVPDMPAAISGARTPTTGGLKTVYADPRFWRLAPLSATCIGTGWALQGLWAAPRLSDVEGLDRSGLLQHLFIMAIALSLGALLWGVAVDRLRRRGVGPRALLGLVATIFIAAQLALILRLPLPSYFPWIIMAATGAGTVLSYAILAEYFPTELAGRANAALNLFHIGGAFVVHYMTGLVVQLWAPTDGHYPEIAYQTAFAFNVSLQIAAGIWFAQTWVLAHWRCLPHSGPCHVFSPIRSPSPRRILQSRPISRSSSLGRPRSVRCSRCCWEFWSGWLGAVCGAAIGCFAGC
jgi:MFS family permease